MLERFYPNEYLDSVYDIDFEMYYKQGIRGIISDIDNTLVPHGAPATEEIVALFDKIHKLGIDTCLISNNQEPRVEPFAYAVKSKYIFDAHKPSTKNYKKAMELMGTTPKNTLFLGDQIFTDIWGANRAGVHESRKNLFCGDGERNFKKHSKNLEIVYKKEQPTLKKVL